MSVDSLSTTFVLGGGPAGLTAGYLLGKAGGKVVVLEAEDQEAAITKAEDLFRHLMPPPPQPEESKVEVVMSLPVRVGQR